MVGGRWCGKDRGPPSLTNGGCSHSIEISPLGAKPWLCCSFSHMPPPPSSTSPSSSSSSSSFISLSRALARKLVSGSGLLLGRFVCRCSHHHSCIVPSHHHLVRRPTGHPEPNSTACSNWYYGDDSSGSRMSFSSSSSSYDPEAIAECLEFIRKCALGKSKKNDDDADGNTNCSRCTQETRKERLNGHQTKSPLCHSPLDIP